MAQIVLDEANTATVRNGDTVAVESFTRHAGCDATGWRVRFAARVAETPTADEFAVLRELHRCKAATRGAV